MNIAFQRIRTHKTLENVNDNNNKAIPIN